MQSVQKLQIFPLNQREKYSFAEGNPIINLQIGRQEAFVDGRSVYLNFKLTTASRNGDSPPLQDFGTPTTKVVYMNERVGAWSVIDRITVSEASRNQTIEGVRDVGRVLAAVRPSCVSPLQMNTGYNCKALCGTRKRMTANLLKNGIEVSLQLAEVSGFLAHGLIPLNLIPLNISIQLAPDAQALHISPYGSGANKTAYSISDVSLSADMMIPGPDIKMPKSLEIGFDSYSTVYNVQNSTNQTTSTQLGLGAVKSVFTTVMPPDYQNNILRDSFSTGEFLKADFVKGAGQADYEAPVESVIDRVSFLRAAQNYPIENELEVQPESTAGTPLTPVDKHGLRSVGRRNARGVLNTLMSPATQLTRGAPATATYDNPVSGMLTDTMINGTAFNTVSNVSSTQASKLRVYGVSQDSYSNAGLDYRGVTCGLRVNMDATIPMGLHTTAVARHTMMVKDDVVSVVS